MPNPHQSMGYPTDAQPVRPGTSDALTARTIDATVHPPLVRAQESVTGLAPRIAQAVAPLASPLFISAVGLTLIFWWVARRMRYRPSALVLSGLLVMTLTSFRPAADPEPTRDGRVGQVAQVRIPRTVSRGSKAWYRYHGMPGRAAGPTRIVVDEPSQIVMEPPTPPEPLEAPDMGPDPRGFEIPRIPIARIPEVSVEMVRAAEQMMRDNEQVQRVMQQMRHRVREEARRRRWQRDYGIVLTR